MIIILADGSGTGTFLPGLVGRSLLHLAWPAALTPMISTVTNELCPILGRCCRVYHLVLKLALC